MGRRRDSRDTIQSTGEGGSGDAVLRPVRSVVEATYGVVASRGGPVDLDTLRERFEAELAADTLAGLGAADEKP